MNPKTIFITATDAVIAHYFLRSGLLQFLSKRSGLRVILIVPDIEEKNYRQEFGGLGVTIVGIPIMQPGSAFWYERVLSLSRAAFNTGGMAFVHWRQHYVQGVPLWKTLLRRMVAKLFGRSRSFQSMVRSWALRVSLPKVFGELLDTYKPDLVYATAISNSTFEFPLLLEAQRRGIKTAASARNWDNLCHYGFFLIHPDRLILQNEFMKESAVKFHFFPEERIRVTGFPHFDRYLKKEYLMSREDFLRSLHIDPRKRVILYAVSGEIFERTEIEVTAIFDELIKTKKIPEDLIMIFRAHPLFKTPLDSLKSISSVVPDRVLGYQFQTVGKPEMDERDMKHFINSIIHSELIILIGGTVALEAACFHKPIICFAYDGNHKEPYWFSVDRLYDIMNDWMVIMECNGMRKAKSAAELADAINAYLKNPSLDEEGRECIKRRFATGFDGKATERLAQELLALL